MVNATFSTDAAPGYLEYVGRPQSERVTGNVALCARMEVREMRAEFQVYNVEFMRGLNSHKWREVKRELQTVHSNKLGAVEWVKGYEREYWQAVEKDFHCNKPQDHEVAHCNEPAPSRLKFWSDDFNMDLIKVFPDFVESIADIESVGLVTHGGTSYGRLNHPSSWNDYKGPIAFFGFSTPDKPDSFYTSSPVVECTFLEMLRDCWAHSLYVYLCEKPFWDAWMLQTRFTRIMYDIRGWGTDCRIKEDRKLCLKSLNAAAVRFRAIVASQE
jgi:hypothetical protein